MSEQDFAEGKTQEEEAVDSMQMLGVALLASMLILVVVGLVVWAVW